MSNTNISGNAGFYSSDINAASNDVRLKRKDKFEPKLLVWIAFSTKGISQQYIAPSAKQSMKMYISKCLVRLEKFIEKHHKNENIVFWPDLASSHYSRKVQSYLKAKNIEFVPKEHNPANLPELHPIEDFWSELKRLVYNKNCQAENLGKLKKRIEFSIKRIDIERVHRLAAATFTRVDTVRRHGMKNL